MLSKKEVDKHNRLLLANDEETDYICSMCRKVIGKSESYSCRGYNLICINCFDKMCDILNISPLQLMDIIHTKYKIPKRSNIEFIYLMLDRLCYESECHSGTNAEYSFPKIYDTYWNLYKLIHRIRKQYEDLFGRPLNYEQNMNKKIVDNPYQE